MAMKVPLLLVSVGCLWVGSFFVFRWLERSPINRTAFDQIGVGMTLIEVEEIIGLPPGEYGYKNHRVQVLPEAAESFWYASYEKRYVFWSSNDGEIIVSVSPEGMVTGKMFYELEGGQPETVMEIVRRWLGLQPANATLPPDIVGVGSH